MYYRKYFSGVVDTLAVTTGVTITSKPVGAGAGKTQYRSLKTTPILCNAIICVLQEIGLPTATCRLDAADPDTYGEIFPYGDNTQGIHIFFGNTASSTCHNTVMVMLCPDSSIKAATSSTDSGNTYINCQITSASTGTDVPYQFYITVKGDPNSLLEVMLSSYAAPDTEIELFSFGKGTDCFGTDVVCYSVINGTTLYFFDMRGKTYINRETPITNIAQSAHVHAYTDTIVKGCPPDTVALIPWIYEPLVGVTINNCYCVPTSLVGTNNDERAFLINGEEYWLFKLGRILARCSTKLPVR